MKNLSSALLTLLQTGEYVSADLWTITLNGGTVIRWASHDKNINYGGFLFQKVMIERGQIAEKTGVDVATLDVTITALDSMDSINGQPVLQFIANHGLDGANVKLERGFAPDWNTPITGTVLRFAGKVTSVNSIQGIKAKLTVSSWMVLLNVNMPRNLYQAACMHTVYDAGCGLSASAFQTAGHVVGSGGTLNFATNLTPAANYYALGRIVFTSGANNGVSRTVKASDASGNFTLVRPLPNALANGDTFLAFPGCDLTSGANGCAKFSNLPNFKATPFVPLPRTVVGSASSSTTTKSGK